MKTFTVDQIETALKAVERELKMRESVYPRWVSDGKRTAAFCDQELAAMRLAKEMLQELLQVARSQQTLFPE